MPWLGNNLLPAVAGASKRAESEQGAEIGGGARVAVKPLEARAGERLRGRGRDGARGRLRQRGGAAGQGQNPGGRGRGNSDPRAEPPAGFPITGGGGAEGLFCFPPTGTSPLRFPRGSRSQRRCPDPADQQQGQGPGLRLPSPSAGPGVSPPIRERGEAGRSDAHPQSASRRPSVSERPALLSLPQEGRRRRAGL